MITEKDIKNLEKLSRIAVSANEEAVLTRDLARILEYVATIDSAPIPEDLPSSSLASDNKNLFREDNEPHLVGENTDNLLALAPSRQGNFFKVKIVQDRSDDNR